MTKFNKLFAAAFALFVAVVAVQGPARADVFGSDEGWNLAKEQDGIKVWMKQEEGKKFESYRVKTVVDADPATIESVITDVENMPNWWDKAKETKAIKEISEREYIVYLVYDMPWPMKDRDFVQHAKGVENEDGSIIVNISNAWDQYPEQRKLVRVKESYQIWRMRPTEDGKIEIMLQGNSDVGDVPVGMANSMIPAEQLNMVSGMLGAVRAKQ